MACTQEVIDLAAMPHFLVKQKGEIMAEEKSGKINCCVCGRELDKSKAWEMPEKLGGGTVPYCTECMQKCYNYVASVVGYKLAMFICAVMFNVPYLPELFDKAKEFSSNKGVWRGYMIALRKSGYDNKLGKFLGFRDGITDLKKAFGGEYETLKVDDEMLSDEEYAAGHKAQTEMWGYGPEEHPYTQDDYDSLDETYAAITANRPNLGPQAELAVKKISKWTLEQNRCFYNGDYDGAKRLQDMIKIEMENEQLRKKDELPQDTVRIDDIVQAVERANLPMYSYDELCKVLANHSFHKPYPYARDAADQMLLYIRNATAWNEGRAEVASLPPEFSIDDFLNEFAPEQDEEEKKIYRELGIVPMDRSGETEGGE